MSYRGLTTVSSKKLKKTGCRGQATA
ncbi:MAG TPA: palindromic element RPE4 domain-containing protein [Rickettsia endosymbiont of Omalisus fontisbellaquei]|nr:palindromic element RPE4 domain-containing protein [Rickettsia endosymbiont of Omalisus fontisbellaquei]